MRPILLTTLNARYAHTALGLRYLYANMGELQVMTKIVEFTMNEQIQSIAEELLKHSPRIIGIGVYIWNASQCSELIQTLKKVSPDTIIILGGPEAGHLPHRVDLSHADYIISGEGEVAFYELCRNILSDTFPSERFIKAPLPDLKAISLPYSAYNDEDVAHRYIYVEASRGCPFECEFCLSSIDEKVRNFPLDQLLEEFETLWQRGARSFKFIDRTFNLNMTFANRILDFFLSKEPPYFAHFEVIPDHFPDVLKEKIKLFPAGSLQLEIGIQTIDPIIAKGINRPLKLEKIVENLRFLENETHAHMHLDLIVGLPGESIEGFGRNLDTLVSLTHSEIQIGILKNLSGTTLSRHDQVHGMVYSDIPPYDILQNNLLSFEQIQKMKRFARFWDIFYNSGSFTKTVPLIWKNGSVFEGFYAFSEWIYTQTLSTWKISLERQIALIHAYLCLYHDKEHVEAALINDLSSRPEKTIPFFLRQSTQEKQIKEAKTVIPKRQAKRLD
ncbi:MAG: B12-binding domain-containing radical SAM protein [Sulfuricurvum sp. PD_MW2]|uniref:B12-binding domain-containing radical SAM protein n=1 Tax=Sulfuricurvum sp. PD_MW2 TaxID=2027917 RepID=UPI000C061764|nr:B12-binding domain-containing radical SAM protein [Sulfuricurvum sp. PD_MW2]PHM17565.1 MAG: B12-binding domain-containing radical SAM protein [Sulfuricurvum sp. PD_MW2]